MNSIGVFIVILIVICLAFYIETKYKQWGKNMKIKMLVDNGSFKKGRVYKAKVYAGGYWSVNGSIAKFIESKDAEAVK